MSTAVASVIAPEKGKPYLWKSGIYGDVAVHVVGFSPNGKVAKLSVDGGPDATPARNHLALKDGFGYCVISRGELHKRPRRTAEGTVKRTRSTAQRQAPASNEVTF